MTEGRDKNVREIDLFQFGTISYQRHKNRLSGTFELGSRPAKSEQRRRESQPRAR